MPRGPNIPVACTLPASAVPDRLRAWESLRDRAMVRVEATPAGVRMTFTGATAEVLALIEAESQCCAFLQFDVERAGDNLTVDIAAPDGAQIVAHTLAGLA